MWRLVGFQLLPVGRQLQSSLLLDLRKFISGKLEGDFGKTVKESQTTRAKTALHLFLHFWQRLKNPRVEGTRTLLRFTVSFSNPAPA